MQAEGTFQGTNRFSVVRFLGRGGMGEVYEVFDQERQEPVALKCLLHVDPLRLQLFKQEFRNLTDIAAPGLVRFHELFSSNGRWFFTMELVNGSSFLASVREDTGWSADTDGTAETLAASTVSSIVSGEHAGAAEDETVVLPEGQPGDRLLSEEGLSRLRRILPGLLRAVATLHSQGRLHCDLKPSNVMVGATGQVTLLDFGLASKLHERAGREGAVLVGGTVPYMSPEQGAAEPLTPASDWYSVGLMLYEALTGRLPHSGSPHQVMAAKLRADVTFPPELSVRIPTDLVRLCESLLRRHPAEREIPTVAPSSGSSPAPPVVDSTVPSAQLLVGREVEETRLLQWLRETTGNEMVTVHLSGRSGMGKSALLRRFLEKASGTGATVLQGRCYERESVPFKAIDSLVDRLAAHLRTLPELDVAALLPRRSATLVRLFPVLRTVPAIDHAIAGQTVPHASRELRRRAFRAFRELVGGLADRGPLVLTIDDLQWGDADSTALLEDLSRPPDAPGLLLVLSYRHENIDDNPLLQRLRRGEEAISRSGRREFLEVGPLTEEAALELASELTATTDVPSQWLRVAARESSVPSSGVTP